MNANHVTAGTGHRFRLRSGNRQAFAERLEPRSYLSVTFGAPNFATDIRGVTGIAAGDLNGSGHPEIVVAGLSPTVPSQAVVGVYPNQSGSPGTPVAYNIGSNGSASGGVAIGNFDGQQDIAAIDASNNQLTTLLNDGSGSFRPAPSGATALPGTGGDTAIVAADFSGDGKDDLAVVDPNENQVVIAFSNGNGSFALQTPISVAAPQKIVAADFNGDGHVDLAILSGQSPNTLYVAMNNGNGTFAAPVPYSFGSGVSSINDIAAADFNGDGRADLVGVGSSAGGGGLAAVLLAQSTGTFAPATDLSLSGTATSAVTGDFSLAGHADVAALGQGGSLDVLPGNGDGTFGADQLVFTNELATPGSQAVTADFDANGSPDIAYLSRSQGGFGTLLNSTLPPGSVAPSVIAPSLSGKLTTKPIVAGGKIAPVSQIVTLKASSAFSGTVNVNFQFSLTNTFNSNNPTVATLTRKLNLKAGRSQRLAVSIRSLPSGLAGTYYLVGQLTDPTGATSTAASAQTVGIVAPIINLSGGFVAVPRAAKAGRKSTVILGVTNYGTIPAIESLPINIFASTSATLDNSAIGLDQLIRRVLIPAGKSRRLLITIPIPPTPGTYYLIAELDPQNTLNDVNPPNNVFASGTTLAIS